MKGVMWGMIATATLFLSSCIKDSLVFPENVAGDSEQELIDIIVKPTDVVVTGGYEQSFVFKWPAFNEKINKVKITYVDGGDTKEVMVTDFTKDFSIVTSTIGEYKFDISSLTTDGRETAAVEKVATNKGLYIDEIIQFVGASASGDNIIIDWSNPRLASIDVSVFYPTATGEQVYNVMQTEERGEFSFSGLVGSSARLQFKDNKGNIASHTVNYGYTYVPLTSATQKLGWSAQVSSNQSNDGGGAPALIDGNLSTFWHSPWSGTIPPFPFYATITLNEARSLSDVIIALRHNGGVGAPKDIDFQTSDDGINFVTRQSFVNTSTTNGAVLTFNLDNAIKTKYVRINCRTSVSNVTYVSLGEISFTEQILGVL